MAPSKVTSLHAPLHVNESSPIKRLKATLSDTLELDVPARPLLPLMTPHTPVAASLALEPEIDHHLDTNTMISGSSGSASNARGLLSSTHVHWLASNAPITSANCFEIFTTTLDSSLIPPPVHNNPANPATEPDLTSLLPAELSAYIKSLLNHSHDLVDVLKAQRIQIGLDEMVIRCFQQQVYQKEQCAKRQGSLTTLATIATEPVFIEVVKGIEKATKARKAKKEANQEAHTRRKALRALKTALDNSEEDGDGGGVDLGQIHAELQQLGIAPALWPTKPTKQPMKHSARKGKSVNKSPEELSVLSVQAPHTCQGVVCRNYCEDSDSDYMP